MWTFIIRNALVVGPVLMLISLGALAILVTVKTDENEGNK